MSIAKRQGFGIGHLKVHLQPFGAGTLGTLFQQTGNVVG